MNESIRPYVYGRMSSARVRQASGLRTTKEHAQPNRGRLSIAMEADLFHTLRALALKHRTSISEIARRALHVGIHGGK